MQATRIEMNSRSATDTIAGYFYQFDHSILSVLALSNDEDFISVEGIEDIDVHAAGETTAVQCKYYASTEYNHSVIKPAIMLMLTHFKAVMDGTRSACRYKLWGHYKTGQHKLTLPIDIDFLKQHLLTFTEGKVKRYHHEELNLNDDALRQFLERLDVNINAKDLQAQFSSVVAALQSAFSCKPFSAEYFFYNSALRVMRDLAIKPEEAQRRVSRKEFLSRVDTSSILFGEWFVVRKGKKAHYAALRKEYFADLNLSPYERFFLVEFDHALYERQSLKELILLIAKKYSKLTKREPNPFCPYLYVHGLPESEIVAVKSNLLAEGFRIVDGHGFKGAEFSAEAIVQKADHNNGIKLKFINTLSDLTKTITVAQGTKYVYQFYSKELFYSNPPGHVKHTAIQLGNANDIKEII